MFIVTSKDEVQSVGCVSPNTLVLGDSLEVMKYIPDNSIDLVLCDPPYGTTQCKWDSIISLKPMWEQLKRVIKSNGAIVMTASQPFTSVLGASNIDWLRYSWVWKKPHTGQLNAKRMPLKNTEDILVFYKKQPVYNQQRGSGDPYTVRRAGYSGSECYGDQRDHNTVNTGGRCPTQILEFSNRIGKNVHPTQKPVALMEYLVKTYTNEGETVLDFAAGSFTTGVACVNLNRRFIGIEKDENYFRIGKERVLKQEENIASV